jgi:hypothetical protein
MPKFADKREEGSKIAKIANVLSANIFESGPMPTP